jgi:hypothetical protein
MRWITLVHYRTTGFGTAEHGTAEQQGEAPRADGRKRSNAQE